MKKEKLIWPITIIIIALILGLTIYFLQINKQKINRESDNKKIEQKDALEIKNNDDYFLKKVECEKYKDQVIKNIKQFNLIQKPEVRNSNNSGGEPINNLYVENNELKEIFYSPKVNSCVYLESRKTLVKRGADADPNVGDWGVSYETYYLVDVLNNKEIDFNEGLNSLQIISRSERLVSEKDADAIIDLYR